MTIDTKIKWNHFAFKAVGSVAMSPEKRSHRKKKSISIFYFLFWVAGKLGRSGNFPIPAFGDSKKKKTDNE